MSKYKNAPPWQAIKIPASNLPPHINKVSCVVHELDVENAPRYQSDSEHTWCNIFVTDVITAMGFEPGHWVDPDGNKAKQGAGQELTANLLTRWLLAVGPNKGWVEGDKQTATDAARRGHLCVAAWDSRGKGSGHVAILLPEGTIAQAGRTNFLGGTVAEGFGNLPVLYFIQAQTGIRHGK